MYLNLYSTRDITRAWGHGPDGPLMPFKCASLGPLGQGMHPYGIKIRNKKWYWPLITFVIEASVYNLWLLHRPRQLPKTTDNMPLIGFIR